MNISGIRPSLGGFDYNSIRIQQSMANQVQNAPASTSEQQNQQPAVSEQEIAQARSRQTYNSGDFAKEFDGNKSYDLKGADSDIRSLDMEKAISDMQKDQMLHQYQYFVGESANNAANEQVAAIRGAENFNF